MFRFSLHFPHSFYRFAGKEDKMYQVLSKLFGAENVERPASLRAASIVNHLSAGGAAKKEEENEDDDPMGVG